MLAAVAVVTEIGGGTSHAAVVSRELGTPCVVGCGRGALAGLAGKEVTVDGRAGLVYLGRVELGHGPDRVDQDLVTVAGWFGLDSVDELAHTVGV
jgi:pyruvate,orthophosphate dikinase